MRSTQPLASLLVLFGAVSLASPIPLKAAETDQPQIVRVSYVQGEVKLSLGIDGSPDLGKNWIAAGVNFPVEEGVTLATEEGRAEVEFENGSMAYLAEHSVLQFKGLTSNSQGTTTKVALLTGRATFALESNGHDEFTLKTNVASLHLNEARTLRVESALDGAMFRLVEGSITFYEGIPGKNFAVGPGDAFQCVAGELSRVEGLQDDSDQKAWDQWVSEERTARKADIADGLRQSGLAAPIPGLVDMVRGGTFSDCPPYGKCWEPMEPPVPGNAPAAASAIPEPQGQNLGGQGAGDCNASQIPGVRCEWLREDEGTFITNDGPCGRGPMTKKHYWVDKLLRISPEHPEGQVVKKQWGMDCWTTGNGSASNLYPGWWRFPWATCHAGSWLPEPRVQAAGCKPGKADKSGKCQPPKKKWVVGPKRKGGSFLRVKLGKGQGFIPKHPLDVKGKRPLNAQDGILTFHGKGAKEVAEIKSPPKDLQIERSLPAGYDGNWVKNLPKVEQPVIEGRLLKSATPSASSSAPKAGTQKSLPGIRYDYKTRNFVAPSNVAGGTQGKGRPVVIAYLGSSAANGSISRTGNTGGKSGSSGGAQPKGGSVGGSSRGASQSSSGGRSGASGSGSSRSSSGGGSSSHSSSGSGGGGSSSHATSSGGGGSSSHASSGGGGGSSSPSSSSSSSGGGGGKPR